MSEAAWNKAFTQGSSALKKRLMDVHAKNPKFQSWLKSSGHGAGVSVKQASKEIKSSERAKAMKTKSLQAYGATKGAKVGGEYGSGEMKDTIAPLTRDQHSKVQAAARAAKAAEKSAAAPKKPLTKDQRMAAIAAAVRKTKTKHDVPTVDPDDDSHDDLRDLHQSLHVRRGYNEEVEQVAEGRMKDIVTDRQETERLKAQDVLGGPVKTRTGTEPKGKLPLGFRRARNLARQQIKTVKESTTEVNEMSYGKKLAKAIMAKQSKRPIAQQMGEEVIVEQDDTMEKKEMAQTQLHFIGYAAKEILEFIDMGGEIEEWYQNKLSKVQSEVESLHSYIEGEKRRTGMVEEVEQIDELKKSTLKSYVKKASKEMKKAHDYHQMRYGGRDGSDPEYMKKTYPAALAKYDRRDAGVEKAKEKLAKEEVEQIDEKINLVKAKMGDVIKDFKKSDAPQFKGKSMEKRRQMAVAAKLGAEREAGMREEVEQVTEAEGTVAMTPKEKDLAAHHGDPKKITYGDVIKARLKSAAAKKMGK